MTNTLTYRRNGDYLIPNLTVPDPTPAPLGKYGLMRRTFLQQHRPTTYTIMLLTGTLTAHLTGIDKTAQQRLDILIPALAKAAGATEELKASDPMRWVGLMNTCKAQAEETILQELVYDRPHLSTEPNN